MHVFVESVFYYHRKKGTQKVLQVFLHSYRFFASLCLHFLCDITPTHNSNSITQALKQKTRVLLSQSHLRGQVKRPEEKSKHAARHHGDDWECQQPIPLAVVLQICPELRRHQTLPKFGHTFHPDVEPVVSSSPPPPPPGSLDRYPKILAFCFCFSEAYQCGSHQVRGWAQLMKFTSTLVCVSHQGADPVWGEDTLAKGFLVKPNGLSLPDANRGFSTVTQVLLKKASALISLSIYSSLWAITTQSQSIYKKTQQPFPCDWYASVTWPHFSCRFIIQEIEFIRN